VDLERLGFQRFQLAAQGGRCGHGGRLWHRWSLHADVNYRQVLQLLVLVLLVLVQLLQVLVLAVLEQPASSSSPTSAHSWTSKVSACSDSSSS